MFLMARKIKASGIKMVLSGEGSDEELAGYLYFHKAPDAMELHRECVRKLDELHAYDCLRANKSTSAWGLEVRVPFLDRDFLDSAMMLDPALKMCVDGSGNKRMEKWAIRKAFDVNAPEWEALKGQSPGVDKVHFDLPYLSYLLSPISSSPIRIPIQTPILNPTANNYIRPIPTLSLLTINLILLWFSQDAEYRSASKCAPWLPNDVLWRQKEQFSDGVGYNWIDSLRDHAGKVVTEQMFKQVCLCISLRHYSTLYSFLSSNSPYFFSYQSLIPICHTVTQLLHQRSMLFPLNTPLTKEAFYGRNIFARHYPRHAAARTVPLCVGIACSSNKAIEWDEQFKKLAADTNGECSGRAVDVHSHAYKDVFASVAGNGKKEGIVGAEGEPARKKAKH